MSSKRRVSTTVDSALLNMLDNILTPKGFLTPPKGTYSMFLESLLTRHLEEHYNTDIVTLLGAVNAVGFDEKALKKQLSSSE